MGLRRAKSRGPTDPVFSKSKRLPRLVQEPTISGRSVVPGPWSRVPGPVVSFLEGHRLDSLDLGDRFLQHPLHAGLQGHHGVHAPDTRACQADLHDAVRDVKKLDVDRKSTRLNSSHGYISYAVFCLKKKKNI